MTRGSALTKSLVVAATLAGSLALSAVAGAALARDGDHDRDHHHSGGSNHDGDHQHKPTGPVHGPGSSHNPIVYHPVHGPGSSHNPVVLSTSKYAPGTVGRDHRKRTK